MKFSRFLVFGILLTVMAIGKACRKIDMLKEKEMQHTMNQMKAKFYNNHPSTDLLVIALNAYLRRVNEKSDFVKKTVERAGYPYWNKAEIMKWPSAGGRGESDSVQYTYIPFSEENENIVNAALVIRTINGDTATNWICDWQYKDLPHGNAATTGTAENTALFFMQFQHLVFGDSIFYISDSTLFPGLTWPAWEAGRRGMKVKTNTTGGRIGMRSNAVWECNDIFYCGAPSPAEWPACFDANGCDYDEGCPGIGEQFCYLVEANCTCLVGCDGGGSGEPIGDPPPGSGGGGSTPPPPECQPPVANRGMDAPLPGECPPGWSPPPPPPPPVPEPIDSMLSKYSRKFRHVGDSLYNNLSLPNNKEYFFAGARNISTNDTAILNIRTDHDSTYVIPNITSPGFYLLYIWHSHVSASMNTADRRTFSPADIDYLRRPACLKLNFTSFADCGNKQYALVITDVSKAQAFFAANNYDLLDINYTTTGGGNMQEVDERCVKNALGSAVTNGISFYVSSNSPQFTNWTLLNQ